MKSNQIKSYFYLNFIFSKVQYTHAKHEIKPDRATPHTLVHYHPPKHSHHQNCLTNSHIQSTNVCVCVCRQEVGLIFIKIRKNKRKGKVSNIIIVHATIIQAASYSVSQSASQATTGFIHPFQTIKSRTKNQKSNMMMTTTIWLLQFQLSNTFFSCTMRVSVSMEEQCQRQ